MAAGIAAAIMRSASSRRSSLAYTTPNRAIAPASDSESPGAAARLRQDLSGLLQPLHQDQRISMCVGPEIANAIKFESQGLQPAGVSERTEPPIDRNRVGGIEPLRLLVRSHRFIGEPDVVINLAQLHIGLGQIRID